MLEAAELAPRGVELARHAQEVHPQRGHVFRGHRIMVVSPSAGRERLELQMREVLQQITASGRNVAGVVENRHVGIDGRRGGGRLLVVAPDRVRGRLLPVLRLRGVEAVRLHPVHAPLAAALAFADDVEEDAVAAWVPFHDFADLGAEVVEIGRVEAHLVEARLGRRFHPARVPAVGRDTAPFRMLGRRNVVDARGEVDRVVDVQFAAGRHLGVEQVEGQARVHPPHGRGMVGPAMMALREDRDGIHVPALELSLELRFVEAGADTGNGGRGVEIQMNLTEAQGRMSRHDRFPQKSLEMCVSLADSRSRSKQEDPMRRNRSVAGVKPNAPRT